MQEPAKERTRKDRVSVLLNDYSFVDIRYFQVLEAIFRMAMMKITDSRVSYDREKLQPHLFNRNLAPEARFSALTEYCQTWEQETGMSYGLHHLHMVELSRDQALVEEYEQLRVQLLDLSRTRDRGEGQRPGLLDEALLDSIMTSLQDRLRERVGDGLRVGKYLRFSPDTYEPVLEPENHHYFTLYVGIACGVFRQFFEQSDQPSKFKRFLHGKLRFEHAKHPFVTALDPQRINNRITHSRKTYESIADEVRGLGLIDDDFVEFLAQPRQRSAGQRVGAAE